MSNHLESFMQYAAAFEAGFAADDWGLIDVTLDE
jgi:hypothetical protein